MVSIEWQLSGDRCFEEALSQAWLLAQVLKWHQSVKLPRMQQPAGPGLDRGLARFEEVKMGECRKE